MSIKGALGTGVRVSTEVCPENAVHVSTMSGKGECYPPQGGRDNHLLAGVEVIHLPVSQTSA